MLDPYLLAHSVFGDPTITDEQKLAHLAEIGSTLGIETVGQFASLRQRGMPLDMVVRQMHGAISRHEDFTKRMADQERERERREDYARQIAELDAKWGPKLREQWEKVLDAANRAHNPGGESKE